MLATRKGQPSSRRSMAVSSPLPRVGARRWAPPPSAQSRAAPLLEQKKKWHEGGRLETILRRSTQQQLPPVSAAERERASAAGGGQQACVHAAGTRACSGTPHLPRPTQQATGGNPACLHAAAPLPPAPVPPRKNRSEMGEGLRQPPAPHGSSTPASALTVSAAPGATAASTAGWWGCFVGETQ